MRTHPDVGLVIEDLFSLIWLCRFSATVCNYHACFSFLPDIRKVLLLLTDGFSNGIRPGNPANNLRKLGISIFSIGVGPSVSQTELKEIASDPDTDYVFTLNSFNQLSSFVDRISSASCSGKYSFIRMCAIKINLLK